MEKRAREKFMAAAEIGKHEKVTELDVFPLVVQNNFRDGPECEGADLKLIKHAKDHCSVAMQSFLFKLDRRDMLKGLIRPARLAMY